MTDKRRCLFPSFFAVGNYRKVLALDAERYALTDEAKSYNLSGILHVNQSKSSAEAKEEASLKTVVAHLEKSYCGKIAYEFMHIPVRLLITFLLVYSSIASTFLRTYSASCLHPNDFLSVIERK